MGLMAAVVVAAPDPALFVPDDRSVVARHITAEGFTVLAVDDGTLLTVTVTAELSELVNAGYHNDEYTVYDALAEKAVTGLLPYDSSYEVVGVDGEGNLLVEFSTSLGAEMDSQYGEGTFAACRAGDDMAVCADCDEPYDLAEGHDCPSAEAGSPGDGGCEHRAYADTCPECR